MNQAQLFKNLMRALNSKGIEYSFDVPGHPSIGWIDIFKDGELAAHIGIHPEEGYGLANADLNDLTHKVDEVYGESLEALLEDLQKQYLN